MSEHTPSRAAGSARSERRKQYVLAGPILTTQYIVSTPRKMDCRSVMRRETYRLRPFRTAPFGCGPHVPTAGAAET